MTGRNMGKPSARIPIVPAPMIRLGALLTKAELIELCWAAACSALVERKDFERLTLLVALANMVRRVRKADKGPVDASNLSGEGVFVLRRACAEALLHEREKP
jgi:hypothetical protein